jgi:hypothetical protein
MLLLLLSREKAVFCEAVRCGEPAMQAVRPVLQEVRPALQEGFPTQVTGVPPKGGAALTPFGDSRGASHRHTRRGFPTQRPWRAC